MASMIRMKRVGLFLALAAAIAVPGTLLAQGESGESASLTLSGVKERIKENKKYLKEAKKRGRAGDAAGMQTALENYERGVEGLERALSAGRFEGDVYEREEASNRVQKATRKHGEVLENLLESGKIPEQARAHVEHALEVSQKGRETALANLDQARAQRREHEAAQRRQGLGQPGTFGRPEGVGRPGGVGGAPSSVGRPSGVGGGAAGAPGAGRGGGRGPG